MPSHCLFLSGLPCPFSDAFSTCGGPVIKNRKSFGLFTPGTIYCTGLEEDKENQGATS